MSGRKLVLSLAIILENKNPQPANYLHGILILIILTGQICFATTWKITLESGEKFNGITQIYINETTVYLIPRIMPQNNLPIPVYLGDIKAVKCIRYNRFTTAIILGATGYFLAQYTFDNDIIWDAIGVNMWISDARDDIGDTVTVTWNNSGTGDNNVDLSSISADLSGWGGGASVTMTDTTGCTGTLGDDVYEACFTVSSGAIDGTLYSDPQRCHGVLVSGISSGTFRDCLSRRGWPGIGDHPG